jgi:hypothetical protein
MPSSLPAHTPPPCMLQGAIVWSRRTIETRGPAMRWRRGAGDHSISCRSNISAGLCLLGRDTNGGVPGGSGVFDFGGGKQRTMMTPIPPSSAPHRKPSPTLRFLVCAIAAAMAAQNSWSRMAVSRFNAGLSRLFKTLVRGRVSIRPSPCLTTGGRLRGRSPGRHCLGICTASTETRSGTPGCSAACCIGGT